MAVTLTRETGIQWDYHPTGGNCWALVAMLPTGETVMVTDELLSNEITDGDTVTVGIYADENAVGTGDGDFHTLTGWDDITLVLFG